MGTVKFISCPLDLTSKNQLTFSSKSAQQSYFGGLARKTITDCNYMIKKSGDYIDVLGTVDTYKPYNYLMYQNDGESYRYAFIVDSEYLNKNTTRIYTKTDVWQTYQFDISFRQSFVEREHCTSDELGENILPEPLELGELVTNTVIRDVDINELAYLVFLTYEVNDEMMFNTINGVASGLNVITAYTASEVESIVKATEALSRVDVVGISTIPKVYANNHKNNPHLFRPGFVNDSLDGYTPRNKKLCTYPYSYLQVSNNQGSALDLRFELFSNQNDINFASFSAISQCVTVTNIPMNYKGEVLSYENQIDLSDLPTVAWSNNSFQLYKTENRNAQAFNILANAVTSCLTMSPLPLLGAVTSGVGELARAYDKPNQVHGQSLSDNRLMYENLCFTYRHITIQREQAERIDRYFDMYGYQVNDFKVPNLKTRPNWNYIKTSECNLVANGCNATELDEIKDMFNKGITLWHNPNTFLNYSANNSL